MGQIVFFDTEVAADGGKIVDFGVVDEKGDRIHTGRVDLFMAFIKEASFLCGQNIIKHDLRFLERHDMGVMAKLASDTLALSPLLFPRKLYCAEPHSKSKDDEIIFLINYLEG
jgi:ATP-dependent DNA helicase RecQ